MSQRTPIPSPRNTRLRKPKQAKLSFVCRKFLMENEMGPNSYIVVHIGDGANVIISDCSSKVRLYFDVDEEKCLREFYNSLRTIHYHIDNAIYLIENAKEKAPVTKKKGRIRHQGGTQDVLLRDFISNTREDSFIRTQVTPDAGVFDYEISFRTYAFLPKEYPDTATIHGTLYLQSDYQKHIQKLKNLDEPIVSAMKYVSEVLNKPYTSMDGMIATNSGSAGKGG